MAAKTPRRRLRRDPQPLNAKRLVVTSGEPAGIGPDLAIAAALTDWPCELVFAGDPALFAARAAALGVRVAPAGWRADAPPAPHRAGRMPVLPLPLAAVRTMSLFATPTSVTVTWTSWVSVACPSDTCTFTT